jgi:hypothetical protein
MRPVKYTKEIGLILWSIDQTLIDRLNETREYSGLTRTQTIQKYMHNMSNNKHVWFIDDYLFIKSNPLIIDEALTCEQFDGLSSKQLYELSLLLGISGNQKGLLGKPTKRRIYDCLLMAGIIDEDCEFEDKDIKFQGFIDNNSCTRSSSLQRSSQRSQSIQSSSIDRETEEETEMNGEPDGLVLWRNKVYNPEIVSAASREITKWEYAGQDEDEEYDLIATQDTFSSYYHVDSLKVIILGNEKVNISDGYVNDTVFFDCYELLKEGGLLYWLKGVSFLKMKSPKLKEGSYQTDNDEVIYQLKENTTEGIVRYSADRVFSHFLSEQFKHIKKKYGYSQIVISRDGNNVILVKDTIKALSISTGSIKRNYDRM